MASALDGVLSAASPENGEWVFGGILNSKIPLELTGPLVSGVIDVAVGEDHTLALRGNGQVVGWGRNQAGQLNMPASVSSGVTAIAAGATTSMALKTDESLVFWGGYAAGEIALPEQAREGVRAVALGAQHQMVLKNDGSVFAWGNNTYGQSTVPPEAMRVVVSIAAGPYHSTAVKSDGSLVYWGYKYRYDHEITIPYELKQMKLVAVATSGPRCLFLRSDGAAVDWNSTDQGGLYNGAPEAAGSGVVAIAMAGSSENSTRYALKADGSYVYWTSSYSVTVPAAEDGKGVAKLSVGPNHNAFALRDGSVVCSEGYYSDIYGQSSPPVFIRSGYAGIQLAGYTGTMWAADGSLAHWGDGSTNLTSINGVSAFALGAGHAVALTGGGSVTAVGANNYYQCNVPAAAASGVTAVAAGKAHTLALKANGSVVAWGAGPTAPSSSGGGGGVTVIVVDGVSYNQSYVPAAAESGVKAIAAGGSQSLALKSDGTLLAWGKMGQASIPPAAQSGVAAIAAGDDHITVLKTNGSVVAWGGSVAYGESIVPAAAASGVVAIRAGGNHTVALKSDGTVVVWGRSEEGQTVVPAGIQGRVTAISAGPTTTFYRVGLPPVVPSFATAAGSAGLAGASAAASATPHKDGVPNLLKYAFNLKLNGPDAKTLKPDGNAGLPSMKMDRSAGQPVWRAEYVRRRNSGLVYTPQKSIGMSADSFSPMTGPQTVTYLDAQWEKVTILEPCNPVETPRMFSRVKVTAP